LQLRGRQQKEEPLSSCLLRLAQPCQPLYCLPPRQQPATAVGEMDRAGMRNHWVRRLQYWLGGSPLTFVGE
jgi:hypothetical protein